MLRVNTRESNSCRIKKAKMIAFHVRAEDDSMRRNGAGGISMVERAVGVSTLATWKVMVTKVTGGLP